MSKVILPESFSDLASQIINYGADMLSDQQTETFTKSLSSFLDQPKPSLKSKNKLQSGELFIPLANSAVKLDQDAIAYISKFSEKVGLNEEVAAELLYESTSLYSSEELDIFSTVEKLYFGTRAKKILLVLGVFKRAWTDEAVRNKLTVLLSPDFVQTCLQGAVSLFEQSLETKTVWTNFRSEMNRLCLIVVFVLQLLVEQQIEKVGKTSCTQTLDAVGIALLDSFDSVLRFFESVSVAKTNRLALVLDELFCSAEEQTEREVEVLRFFGEGEFVLFCAVIDLARNIKGFWMKLQNDQKKAETELHKRLASKKFAGPIRAMLRVLSLIVFSDYQLLTDENEKICFKTGFLLKKGFWLFGFGSEEEVGHIRTLVENAMGFLREKLVSAMENQKVGQFFADQLKQPNSELLAFLDLLSFLNSFATNPLVLSTFDKLLSGCDFTNPHFPKLLALAISFRYKNSHDVLEDCVSEALVLFRKIGLDQMKQVLVSSSALFRKDQIVSKNEEILLCALLDSFAFLCGSEIACERVVATLGDLVPLCLSLLEVEGFTVSVRASALFVVQTFLKTAAASADFFVASLFLPKEESLMAKLLENMAEDYRNVQSQEKNFVLSSAFVQLVLTLFQQNKYAIASGLEKGLSLGRECFGRFLERLDVFAVSILRDFVESHGKTSLSHWKLVEDTLLLLAFFVNESSVSGSVFVAFNIFDIGKSFEETVLVLVDLVKTLQQLLFRLEEFADNSAELLFPVVLGVFADSRKTLVRVVTCALSLLNKLVSVEETLLDKLLDASRNFYVSVFVLLNVCRETAVLEVACELLLFAVKKQPTEFFNYLTAKVDNRAFKELSCSLLFGLRNSQSSSVLLRNLFVFLRKLFSVGKQTAQFFHQKTVDVAVSVFRIESGKPVELKSDAGKFLMQILNFDVDNQTLLAVFSAAQTVLEQFSETMSIAAREEKNTLSLVDGKSLLETRIMDLSETKLFVLALRLASHTATKLGNKVLSFDINAVFSVFVHTEHSFALLCKETANLLKQISSLHSPSVVLDNESVNKLLLRFPQTEDSEFSAVLSLLVLILPLASSALAAVLFSSFANIFASNKLEGLDKAARHSVYKALSFSLLEKEHKFDKNRLRVFLFPLSKDFQEIVKTRNSDGFFVLESFLELGELFLYLVAELEDAVVQPETIKTLQFVLFEVKHCSCVPFSFFSAISSLLQSLFFLRVSVSATGFVNNLYPIDAETFERRVASYYLEEFAFLDLEKLFQETLQPFRTKQFSVVYAGMGAASVVAAFFGCLVRVFFRNNDFVTEVLRFCSNLRREAETVRETDWKISAEMLIEFRKAKKTVLSSLQETFNFAKRTNNTVYSDSLLHTSTGFLLNKL